MTAPATLAEVKAGVEVIIFPRRDSQRPYRVSVIHATPTQIVTGSVKYRRRDGGQVGERDSWERQARIRVGPEAEAELSRLKTHYRKRWASEDLESAGRRLALNQKTVIAMRAACDAAEAALRELGEWTGTQEDAAHKRHQDAAERVLRYLDDRHERPVNQLGDSVHTVHGGVENGGHDLTLSDLIEVTGWAPDRKRDAQEGETP
jgi:hypothetical protein